MGREGTYGEFEAHLRSSLAERKGIQVEREGTYGMPGPMYRDAWRNVKELLRNVMDRMIWGCALIFSSVLTSGT